MKQLPKNFIVDCKGQLPIDDITKLNFNSFIDNAMVVYIEPNLSTLEVREMVFQYQESNFYPTLLIKRSINDSSEGIEKKIKRAKANIKKVFFLNRLVSVAKEQCKHEDDTNPFDFIVTHLESCPFCGEKSVLLSHDYGNKSTLKPTLKLCCSSCNETIVEEVLRLSNKLYLDTSFAYNEKIKVMLDIYLSDYPNNKSILIEIQNELEKNTPKTSWI